MGKRLRVHGGPKLWLYKTLAKGGGGKKKKWNYMVAITTKGKKKLGDIML